MGQFGGVTPDEGGAGVLAQVLDIAPGDGEDFGILIHEGDMFSPAREGFNAKRARAAEDIHHFAAFEDAGVIVSQELLVLQEFPMAAGCRMAMLRSIKPVCC